MFRSTLRQLALPVSVAVALAATGLGACVATVDQRGNLPEPDKFAQIHPGTTTKEQVAKILGTPSSTGIFDDKNWYYISRRTKQIAFLDPDVLDQQVYIVNFDDKGVVRGVDHDRVSEVGLRLPEEPEMPQGFKNRLRALVRRLDPFHDH